MGSTLIIVAIVVVPVLVGGAIDFSLANVIKTRLQGAIDATILAVATNLEATNRECLADTQKVSDADYPASGPGALWKSCPVLAFRTPIFAGSAVGA